MLVFDDARDVRSVQLYGTDPVYVGKAAEILCAEYGVAHIDLNFGCPVPKVTRKGGGGALPWKRGLLGEILERGGRRRDAVRRPGHHEDPQGHRRGPPDLPRRRPDRPGVRLRGDRAARPHGGAVLLRRGRLGRDRRLVEHVDIPVLGNGDIWEAADAVRMVEQTGAAGVVVGRGCLGRPWLFRDLAAAFAPGEPVATAARPWARCAPMMRRHAELLCEHMGEERGCKEFRKHVSWYLKGFRAGGELRHSLALVDSLASARRAARRPRPGRAVPGRRARHAPRPAGLAARPRWPSPRAGSTTPTGPACHVQEDSNETTRRVSTAPRARVTGNTLGNPGGDWDTPARCVLDSTTSCPFRYQLSLSGNGPPPDVYQQRISAVADHRHKRDTDARRFLSNLQTAQKLSAGLAVVATTSVVAVGVLGADPVPATWSPPTPAPLTASLSSTSLAASADAAERFVVSRSASRKQ